jgi:hypothetical protein
MERCIKIISIELWDWGICGLVTLAAAKDFILFPFIRLYKINYNKEKTTIYNELCNFIATGFISSWTCALFCCYPIIRVFELSLKKNN